MIKTRPSKAVANILVKSFNREGIEENSESNSYLDLNLVFHSFYMLLKIKEYQIKKLKAHGAHVFLKGRAVLDGSMREIEIFFRDRLEEKKLFEEAEITLAGDLVEADGAISLVDSRVIEVKLLMELPLESLNIKDRLNATGLIHEFRQVFRKDKIRAKEILIVLGVNEEYAEEILLRNSYILPDN